MASKDNGTQRTYEVVVGIKSKRYPYEVTFMTKCIIAKSPENAAIKAYFGSVRGASATHLYDSWYRVTGGLYSNFHAIAEVKEVTQ